MWLIRFFKIFFLKYKLKLIQKTGFAMVKAAKKHKKMQLLNQSNCTFLGLISLFFRTTVKTLNFHTMLKSYSLQSTKVLINELANRAI